MRGSRSALGVGATVCAKEQVAGGEAFLTAVGGPPRGTAAPVSLKVGWEPVHGPEPGHASDLSSVFLSRLRLRDATRTGLAHEPVDTNTLPSHKS